MTDSPQSTLSFLDQLVKKEFDTNRRVLSFEEYLQVFAENPTNQTRSSAQMTVDMLDYFGKEPIHSAGKISPPNLSLQPL